MKITPTYLDGIILAANAMGCGLTIVDCHDCFLDRARSLNAGNDWGSPPAEAWTPVEDHRFRSPNWSARKMVTGTADALRAEVRSSAVAHPGEPILICPSWLTNLLQSDLEGVAQDLASELGRPVLVVPRMSTDDDWIDGIRAYQAAALELLLRGEGSSSPVVRGYCLFRREGDEQGNVQELRRLWQALALPEARWMFVGEHTAPGSAARGSPAILFPIGADPAAPAVGRDVRLPQLPIGKAGTIQFLRALAAAFAGPAGSRTNGELARRVDDLAGREVAELDESLFQHITNVLAGKAAVVLGDPWTAAGLAGALRELGLDVSLVAVLRRASAGDIDRASLAAAATQVLVDPEYEEIDAFIEGQVALGLCDVIVGADLVRDSAARAGVPFVEVGAPHQLQHYCAPAPYMGFRGMRHLADRLANAIAEAEYQRRFRRSFGPGA